MTCYIFCPLGVSMHSFLMYKARNMGSTASLLADLWALKDGLTLCNSLNLEAVEIELDAKFIVDLVSSTKITIRIISHKCADALVRIGTKLLMDFVLSDTPPLGVVNAFNSDFNGLYSNRLCPKTVVTTLSLMNFSFYPNQKKKKEKGISKNVCMISITFTIYLLLLFLPQLSLSKHVSYIILSKTRNCINALYVLFCLSNV